MCTVGLPWALLARPQARSIDVPTIALGGGEGLDVGGGLVRGAAAAADDDLALVALPLGPRKLRRSWGIGHLRGRRLPLGEETFVGFCRSVAENLATASSSAVSAA